MGRVVAISGGDLESTKALNQYSISLTGKKNPNLLFIGTASKDARSYIENITQAFEGLGCKVKPLCLIGKNCTEREIDELLKWADIIYVGGGDTIFMMEKWKQTGLDQKLKKIYTEDSAVLTGISAGAICWFSCGHSDSEAFSKEEGWQYTWAEGMLDFFHMAFCPHYNEPGRNSFDWMMKEKDIDGLGLDNDSAFIEERGRQFILGCSIGAKAYILQKREGIIVKEEIQIQDIHSGKREF